MLQNDNILIHEFMGWERHPFYTNKMQVKGIEQGYRKLSDFCFIEEINYDKSWDSLMSVVEKIEDFTDNHHGSKYNVNIESIWVEIIDNRSSDIIAKADENTKIESVFKAVVEFIKWYNDRT